MKNPEHSFSLNHNFEGHRQEHFLLKTDNTFFLKEVIKALTCFSPDGHESEKIKVGIWSLLD